MFVMKYERFSFNILHEGTKYQKVLFVIKNLHEKIFLPNLGWFSAFLDKENIVIR